MSLRFPRKRIVQYIEEVFIRYHMYSNIFSRFKYSSILFLKLPNLTLGVFQNSQSQQVSCASRYKEYSTIYIIRFLSANKNCFRSC